MHYDVIVVGARCAGSPTAMLLARAGYRVLLLDRAGFPSDTMSTHMIHPPGVAALRRWGLLDELTATGCPPVTDYSFDFGPFRLTGSPPPAGDGGATGYAPRRTLLDHLLVRAATGAGAELREHVTVDGLLRGDDGAVTGVSGRDRTGRPVAERAAVVVGADGLRSVVADQVGAPAYHQRPTFEAGYYGYWSGLGDHGFDIYIRPGRSFAAIPTNDGLNVVIATWPRDEFEANRHDVEGNFMATLELAPAFAERVRSGRRETRITGTGHLPGFYRRPYGPGWALVGDAGYHKDPCTAQGISDGFRDAGLLAAALDDALAGRRPYDEALGGYQRARDEATLPLYELTCDLATLEPPPPEVGELLGASAGNRAAMDAFAGVIAGTVPPAAFFGPENRARVLGSAAADAAANAAAG
jgi:flavin-dependent dehydrogenase